MHPALDKPCVPPEPETAGIEKEELRASIEEVFLSKRNWSGSLPYTKTRLWMLANDYTVKQRGWSNRARVSDPLCPCRSTSHFVEVNNVKGFIWHMHRTIV